ncbi:MAG: hypothetical protein ACXW2F_08590 [Thermoanaerobaculia bacterium]
MEIGEAIENAIQAAKDALRQIPSAFRPFLFIVPAAFLILFAIWPRHHAPAAQAPATATEKPAAPMKNEPEIRAAIVADSRFAEAKSIDLPRHFTLGAVDFFKEYPLAKTLDSKRIIGVKLMDWGNRIECDIIITESGRTMLGDALDETQPTTFRFITARRELISIDKVQQNSSPVSVGFSWRWNTATWAHGIEHEGYGSRGTALLEKSGGEWLVLDLQF